MPDTLSLLADTACNRHSQIPPVSTSHNAHLTLKVLPCNSPTPLSAFPQTPSHLPMFQDDLCQAALQAVPHYPEAACL